MGGRLGVNKRMLDQRKAMKLYKSGFLRTLERKIIKSLKKEKEKKPTSCSQLRTVINFKVESDLAFF